MEFEQLKESKKIEEKFEEKREGEVKEEIKFEKKISKAEKRKIIIEIANVFDYYKKDYEEKLKLEKQMGFETLYTEMVRENLRKLEEGERQFREGEYPPIFDKIISFYSTPKEKKASDNSMKILKEIQSLDSSDEKRIELKKKLDELNSIIISEQKKKSKWIYVLRHEELSEKEIKEVLSEKKEKES